MPLCIFQQRIQFQSIERGKRMKKKKRNENRYKIKPFSSENTFSGICCLSLSGAVHNECRESFAMKYTRSYLVQCLLKIIFFPDEDNNNFFPLFDFSRIYSNFSLYFCSSSHRFECYAISFGWRQPSVIHLVCI